MAVVKPADHPAGEGGRNGTAIQQSLVDYIISPVMLSCMKISEM